MVPASHSAAAAAAGADRPGAHSGAVSSPHHHLNGHDDDAVLLPQPHRIPRLDENGPGGQLVRMVEAIGSPEAPVPAFEKVACALQPLVSSTGQLYSSSMLLKTIVKHNPALGMQLMRAAVRSGNVVRFRALIAAGADVNGWYDPDGSPVLEAALKYSGPGNDLLGEAVMTGQAAMVPVIVAVQRFDLKCSINLLAHTMPVLSFNRLCTRVTAEQLSCVAAVLAQLRVADDVLAFGREIDDDDGNPPIVEHPAIAIMAAAVGDVAILTRLYNLTATDSRRFDAWVLSARRVAEACGQIPVLQWLHDRSKAHREHIWADLLFGRGTGMHMDPGAAAARHGQLETLDWLAVHGYLGDADEHENADSEHARSFTRVHDFAELWQAAGCSGRMAIVNYLRGHFEMGKRWPSDVLDGAAQGGHLKLMKRLIAAGCLVRQSTLLAAIEHDHLGVVTHDPSS